MSLYPLSVPPLVTYVLRQDINDDHNFCIFILVYFKNTFHSLILSRFPYRQWYNRVSSSEQIPWKQFYYFLAFEFLCHYCWVIKSNSFSFSHWLHPVFDLAEEETGRRTGFPEKGSHGTEDHEGVSTSLYDSSCVHNHCRKWNLLSIICS